MTLRKKFLTALIGMIFFMSILFAAISLYSISSLVSHSSTYISQTYTQQWERLLIYYYLQYRDWTGVQKYIENITENRNQGFQPLLRENNRILVFDSKKNLVGGFRDKNPRKGLEQFSPLGNLLPPTGNNIAGNNIMDELHSITVEGQVVGYYWIDEKLFLREGYLAKGIASVSVIRGLLIGLVTTSLIALFLGVFLTRRFTVPLKRLTVAVKSVGKGDLSQRLEVKGRDEIAALGGAFNRMAEQLNRNEEVRRNMVADIAHELRTPLSVILGKLESIQEGILPQTPETLLPIQDETIRLIRLVRDLQQLSLAEAGKLLLRFQIIDLKKLITKIIEQFAYEFEERGLKAEISGQVPAITADPDRLTQVFVNLIGNALLHTPAGGQIKVFLEERNPQQEEDKRNTINDGIFAKIMPDIVKQRTRGKGIKDFSKPLSSERWVRIVVEDTGEGIPENELDHIFDRFYRVTKARERESGGTGLGLAIAKEFVLAHGGHIVVESVLNKGTRFIIWLSQKPFSDN
jgi:two-component system sensor histidine kinase BaeS